MFTLEYAKDPIWASNDGQCIQLTVKWAEFNEEMPFGATSFDPMPHGVDLYNRAKAGEFGEIAPYPTEIQPAPDQPTTGAQTL